MAKKKRVKPESTAKDSLNRPLRVNKAKLRTLIEEATVDAYNESEQAVGFYTIIEDNLELPFQTEVLGMEVTIEAMDMTEDDQIVAVCRRGNKRQRIPILDLQLPTPLPRGAEWITAYRNWQRGTW